MFDIGFWELLLISIIGLVVLGPERLPTAIRTISSWFSQARNFSDKIKSELNEELRLNELKNNLEQVKQKPITQLSPEIEESLKSLKEAAELVNNPASVLISDDDKKD